MLDDDETILHDRPHKDPGRARAAKVVRARKLAKEIGEPGLSYNPLEVDEGWEAPYRNKNACLEQKLAKEIGEMSDEAVEVAVEKYFVKNPCNEIEIGIMDRHNNDYEKRLFLNAIEENAFLKQERERLIKKLEKIENLSRYAWQQVRNNPDEAEELFRMINLESK